MHILLISATPGILLDGPSGSSLHLRSMANAFYRLGHRVSIAAPGRSRPASLEREVCWLDVTLPTLRLNSRTVNEVLYSHFFARYVFSKLQDDQPDLLYERYSLFSLAGFQLRKRFSVPWFLEVNAPLRLERMMFEDQKLGYFGRQIERMLFTAPDHLFCVSRPLETYILDIVPEASSRITVLGNGLDRRLFTQSLISSHHNEPVVGFVGSFKKWHGLDRWVDIFIQLRRRLPNVKGLMVGDGPQLRTVQEQLRNAGVGDSVTFTGHINDADIPRHLFEIDVLLAPYPTFDPFYFAPLKFYEAMAAGVGILSTAVGDLSKIVGEGGITLPVEPIELWVKTLRTMLTTPEPLRTWNIAGPVQVAARDWMDLAETVLAKLAVIGR